jgi:diamine N-acetyltransferase
MTVSLREICESNFVEAMRLEVLPEQKGFVASNAASIAQSKFHRFLECYGLYDEDTIVGFCAFGKNPEDGTVWIVRFMVGGQFQRKGYGRRGLRVLIDHMRHAYQCDSIFLDIAPGNQAACELYKSSGFIDTGTIQGHSKIYRLDLALAQA